MIAATIAALLLSAADPALNTQAALAAIHACAAQHQSVTVAIVGPEGEERATLRAPDAPPHSLQSARRKAYTAASFAKPTADLAALIAAHPDAAGLAQLDGILFVGGGLPLIDAGKSIGGVGVAGSNAPGVDEICAHAALAVLEHHL